ncbi:uncharacterized protein MONBRDRAFT_18908 [Monosiga brevicollis MX1]|uniref:MGS-like domain-containing protein n=1 Tax=Monosiga brevicollis TaxID=81824 RepID=A9UY99_MONBE|nr:uncharacterized protein MONBRDRAFT_18908 [Monosiga brevicollis MX1]EDQ89822.1 predicted protein [Monosiga brevicollis MX1]|eukprot:XP_001745244.1 hypothetical protein [Monosiga brevicollis MX1]
MAVPIKRALVSVFNKTGLEDLASAFQQYGTTVLSTGGTAKKLRELGVTVVDVSEVTNFPEMLDGRVKTLHPKIHGGLLANRAIPDHLKQLEEHQIEPIDLVVCNLYPFEETVASGKDFAGCIEMIDIGGPTMVRAAAKNCDSVAVVTNPEQYPRLIEEMAAHDGALTLETRRRLARDAFVATARYDSAVAAYMSDNTESPAFSSRHYVQEGALRYGVNPHQNPASYSRLAGGDFPFTVLNGAPGYTNLMDALNSWQLVRELEAALGVPAAASFKHVSPAGAAIARPLTEAETEAFEVVGVELSEQALAYVRARNADPMSSFGDFAALSGTCDASTAKILRREVGDGVIAADYTPEALEILKQKKGGKYLVLKGDVNYVPPVDEVKEVYGVALTQKRNDAVITKDLMTKEIVTSEQLPEDALRDMVLATITVKYTQSNSVCYAVGGQVVGVGAGQQSRVDCVKLAGRKVDTWHMRFHPKVRALKFKKEGVSRPERVNARVAYISDDMTANERAQWIKLFEEEPEPLTAEERAAWSNELKQVCLSSDAFFPFRDNIDQATKHGVSYIAQPGGSTNDQAVIEACNEYGIAMAFTRVRVFHH